MMVLKSHSLTENGRTGELGFLTHLIERKLITELHTMAFGTGTSSNSGQGAEQHPQAIIPKVEEFFSVTFSESESKDDVPLILPGAEQRRHSVRDVGTRRRCRLPIAKRDAHLKTLRARRRFPKSKLNAQFRALRARRRFPKGQLDAHIHTLRAILLPTTDSESVPGDRYSIVMRLAYQYAEKLRMTRDALKHQRESNAASMDAISHENPMVEVLRDPLRVNGQLNLKIACANRSGLLLDLCQALDSKSFTVLDSSFDCSRGSVLLANLRLEKHSWVTPVDVGSEPRPRPLPESEKDEALKEWILSVIRQDTSAGTFN